MFAVYDFWTAMYMTEGALAPEAKYIAVTEIIDSKDIVILYHRLLQYVPV